MIDNREGRGSHYEAEKFPQAVWEKVDAMGDQELETGREFLTQLYDALRAYNTNEQKGI